MFGHLPPLQTGQNDIDDEYDFSAGPTPTTASASGLQQNDAYGQPPAQFPASPSTEGAAEEALLDLVQLEQVHEQAERMKLMGNKHMANQEYAQAFDAYSSALQLSPVGPNSHVFLSNRAAALLSLKKYEAAATDARRAIALAPTFGKAHARLGQAMYFLKRYQEAVAAYQEAVEFEPDNQVTRTYLEKAMAKLNRGDAKSRAGTVASDWESVAWQDSIATDPNRQHSLVTQTYNRGSATERAAMLAATAKVTHDPEFDEAVRIQKRANAYLVNKKYKDAIAEYTAALFLVPYDPVLSPDLHLGRAHALNGSRRHESARKDATMAIKLCPSPAAYSTLAKTQFYLKDYQGSIDSFQACEDLLPEGEELGTFDLAYLEKAQSALDSESAQGEKAAPTKRIIPKLPPPRFVPREQAIAAPTAVPSLPKSWPQQLPTLKCGPERSVLFLSESLGIKLNRGSDGIVRVLTVSSDSASLRTGDLYPGDVVREAAGVDLRRPITNVMWGDTVALIKMAARPIALSVAQELSPTPRAVLEEQKKALAPSSASGDSPVRAKQQPRALDEDDDDIMEVVDTVTDDIVEVAELPPDSLTDAVQTEPPEQDRAGATMETVEEEDDDASSCEDKAPVAKAEEVRDSSDVPAPPQESLQQEVEDVEPEFQEAGNDEVGTDTSSDALQTPALVCEETPILRTCEVVPAEPNDETTGQAEVSGPPSQPCETGDDDSIESVEEPESSEPRPEAKLVAKTPVAENLPSLRTEEDRMIGGDILFLRNSPPAYQGWDTLRWMAHNGARKVNTRQTVYRYKRSERRGLPLFWKQNKQYDERSLIIYEQPSLMLVVRRPDSLEEIQSLLGLEEEATSDDWSLNPETAMQSYWILESVIDPSSAKLRLSTLTTPTSITDEGPGDREKSCFQLLTPVETITLSAVDVRSDVRREERSFTDSGAFLETLSLESVVAQSICGAHNNFGDLGNANTDIAWKHQVIIGSLHALVLSGNQSALEKGLESARMLNPDAGGRLPSRILDTLDDNGFSPLYYACTMKMSGAVRLLVKAGADVTISTETSSMTHICARNLDDQSLSAILSAPTRPNPNELDKKRRTPLYVAMIEGSVLDRGKDPGALSRSIAVLKERGGESMPSPSATSLRHPVCALAYMWLPDYLRVLLKYCPFRFPLTKNRIVDESSVAAMYQYPIHCALSGLRKFMQKRFDKDSARQALMLNGTLQVLLEHGFEPNERLDTKAFGSDRTSLDDFAGFAPLHVLALIALEFSTLKDKNPQVGSIFGDVAELLVRNGARLSLDPPMKERLRHNKQNPSPTWQRGAVEILTAKIDCDNHVLSLLGGAERLSSAKTTWMETKKVANINTKCHDDEKTVVEDSKFAGGSDSLSCCICWGAFGTLMNRKHRCRVMNRYVCDECSSKRLVQASSENRLSDGQFNLARADTIREERQAQVNAAKELRNDPYTKEAMEQKHAALRTDRLVAEERSNRDSLFGGLVGSASNLVFGNGESPRDQIGGLTATLGKTRDALNQRGEKLASLGDKSAQLVDSSSDFAKMAKELRKQSEGGAFW